EPIALGLMLARLLLAFCQFGPERFDFGMPDLEPDACLFELTAERGDHEVVLGGGYGLRPGGRRRRRRLVRFAWGRNLKCLVAMSACHLLADVFESDSQGALAVRANGLEMGGHLALDSDDPAAGLNVCSVLRMIPLWPTGTSSEEEPAGFSLHKRENDVEIETI